MRKALIDIVCCPDDKEVLELRDAKDDGHGDILEGKLHCPECGFDFPIQDGIPNLLPKEFHVKGRKAATRGGAKASGAASKRQTTAPRAKEDASKGQTTAPRAKDAASEGQGKGSKDPDIAKAAGSGDGPEG